MQGRMMAVMVRIGLCLVLSSAAVACGGDDADIEACEPEDACSCTEGVERETACTCVGGSTCSIDGDDIEFGCEGNAACSLECGTNCLITCPGTTTCTVDTGDDAVISCPGTASCDITCRGDCTVDIAGSADALVDCVNEADGAQCTMNGCSPTDCGDGIYACRTSCPG